MDNDHAGSSGSPILAEECLAWARIRRERCCPPLDFLAQGSLKARKHLAQCPACADLMREYEELLECLPEARHADAEEPEKPAPGQLRRILLQAATVNAEDMYNPPLVVILEVIDTRWGLAQVAQVHGEAALAARGDIPILSGYFAESWNVYPMLAEYLGPVLATVPHAVIEEIVIASGRPLPEVPPDTPLQAMRELEIETGFFFNGSSYVKALELLEPAGAPTEKATGAKVIPFTDNGDAGRDPHDGAPKRSQSGVSGVPPMLNGLAACVISPETVAQIAAAAQSPADKAQENSTSEELERAVAAAKSAAELPKAKGEPGEEPQQRPRKFRLRSAWKPLGMAACLVLLVAAVFLGQPVRQPEGQSSPEMTAARPESLSEVVAGLRLFLASGGEVTRGAGGARPFVWERREARVDMPQKWQAFAAGQWTARASSGLTDPPFPQAWLPEGGDASAWQDDPYFALGVTAYAADAACAGGSGPAASVAESLARAARALEGKIAGDMAAARFLEALRRSPLSCARVQETLDDLEADSSPY